MHVNAAISWSCVLLILAAGCGTVRPDRQLPVNSTPDPKAAPPSAKPLDTPSFVSPAAFESSDSLPVPGPEVEARSETLGLLDLEALAFQANPTLSAAAARVQAAQGERVQVGLPPNPSIGYHATQIGNLNTAGGQGAFVQQRFITGHKLQLNRAVASRDVAARQFELRAQEQRVLNDVHVRFYEAFVAQQRVELTAELVQIAANLVRASRTLFSSGQATQNDLLQAEIRAEETQILHDNAANEHAEAWRRLAAVVGVPQLARKRLTGDLDQGLPPLAWDEAYAELLSNHPERNAAMARAERARLQIEREQREPIPDLDLMVSVRHQNVTSSDVANIQAGFPLPLFDRNQGAIQRARADWIAARNEVQRVELELQDRFAVAFRRYSNARQQEQRYRQDIIPRAERSLALVTEGYQQGQVEYLSLLIAQQTHLEATLAHLEALRQLRVAHALIDGSLLSDSLAPTR